MRTDHSLSDDDLQAAWRELRKADWPSLHDLALAAARYQLVQGAARARARGLVVDGRCNVNPPAPAVRPPIPPAPPRAAPTFDHKRAAAGERDDD